MPITLVTGKPGSGKTLWTIQRVEKLRKETGRSVYYWNIPEVTLPWKLIDDPKSVHDLPQGAIVVMDETQQIFPNRKAGSPVPSHVQPFDTHRHRGHDFFLLTQYPTFIDYFIRELTAVHVHLRRSFGMEYSTLITWQEVMNVKDRDNDGLGVKERFNFPRELYGVYKSADQHTIQKRLPWKKLAVLVGMAAAVPLLLWTGYSTLSNVDEYGVTTVVNQGAADVTPSAILSSGSASVTRSAYDISSFKPRVDGLAHTAPAFDAVNVVKVMPKIDGCMHILKNGETWKCYCNSQQGTRLPLSVRQCEFYMSNGWFDYTDPEKTTRPDDEYYEQQWERAQQMSSPVMAETFSGEGAP